MLDLMSVCIDQLSMQCSICVMKSRPAGRWNLYGYPGMMGHLSCLSRLSRPRTRSLQAGIWIMKVVPFTYPWRQGETLAQDIPCQDGEPMDWEWRDGGSGGYPRGTRSRNGGVPCFRVPWKLSLVLEDPKLMWSCVWVRVPPRDV